MLAARVPDRIHPTGIATAPVNATNNPPSGSSAAPPRQRNQPPDLHRTWRAEHRQQPEPTPRPRPAQTSPVRRWRIRNRWRHHDRRRGRCRRGERRHRSGHRSRRHNLGGCRWAARELHVDRHHLPDRTDDTVGVSEHPSVQGAIAARDHHPRLRCRRDRVAQRVGHVAGDNTGHQQRIGVPRRRDQPSAEPLRVIHRPERRRNLHLAAIAGTRVDVADLQRTRHSRRRIDRRLRLPVAVRPPGRPARSCRSSPCRYRSPARRSSSTATRSLSTLVNSASHRQQFRNMRRRDRIDDRIAVFAGDHHTSPAQHAELLRQVDASTPTWGSNSATDRSRTAAVQES